MLNFFPFCPAPICLPPVSTLLSIAFHLLEKEMATHSSILAWKISWTEEPGRLQSTGLQRVGHDWSDLALTHACTFHLFLLTIKTYLQVAAFTRDPLCTAHRGSSQIWYEPTGVCHTPLRSMEIPLPQGCSLMGRTATLFTPALTKEERYKEEIPESLWVSPE